MGGVDNLGLMPSVCHLKLEDTWGQVKVAQKFKNIRKHVDAARKKVDSRVVEFAEEALGQLGPATFVAGVRYFVDRIPSSMHVLAKVQDAYAIYLIVKLAAYVIMCQGWLADPGGRIKKKFEFSQASVDSSQRLSSVSLVNVLSLAGPHFIVHEVGHWVVAKVCYQDLQPTIKISPFEGGATKYNGSYELSSFGRMLGDQHAYLLLLLGGIIASTLFALGEFAVAHAIESTRPQLSELLELHGLTQLLGEFIYGFASLLDPEDVQDGDFCIAWKLFGLHPTVVLALIVLLPAAQRLYLKSVQKRPLKSTD